MAKPNPLDAFVRGSTTNDFRLRDAPKLGEYVRTHGLAQGLEQYDAAHAQWVIELTQAVNTRLQPKTPATPLGVGVTKPAAATPPQRTTTAPATGGTSSSGTSSTTIGGIKFWVAGSDPTGSSGSVGDMWLNSASLQLFGPKASGGWGAAVSLFPLGKNLVRGVWPLASGSTGDTVTGLGLPFTPLVIATVAIPPGGQPLWASVVSGSESPDGFTFKLGPVATDSDQYRLGFVLVPNPAPVAGPISGLTGAGGDVMTGAGGDEMTGAGES